MSAASHTEEAPTRSARRISWPLFRVTASTVNARSAPEDVLPFICEIQPAEWAASWDQKLHLMATIKEG